MKFQLIGLVSKERKSIFYAFPIWLATFLVLPNQFFRQKTWEDRCLIGQVTMQKPTLLIGCFNTSRNQCDALSLLSVTTQTVPWTYKKKNINWCMRKFKIPDYQCVPVIIVLYLPRLSRVMSGDSDMECSLPHLLSHYNNLNIFSMSSYILTRYLENLMIAWESLRGKQFSRQSKQKLFRNYNEIFTTRSDLFLPWQTCVLKKEFGTYDRWRIWRTHKRA